MEISIVTGTYNRLHSLQTMVQSARDSLCGLYGHEFVVVDGGSTDGTIEWCKTQQDINLIEQGQLLGAVFAFNAGARAAVGRYVILANDDITFHENSILVTYTYMQTHRYCGIGCFHQDRDGLPFHVSRMRGVAPNKTIVSVYYGQVCIVPKWLGDTVGWWGDYLHTYGGDNELSCNVWELGYTVDAIPCACISDSKVEDDLRKINNADHPLGQHPDTKKWSQKWPNGPHIPDKHIMRDSTERLRILYMPVFEPGNAIQKTTKTGLRNALHKVMGSVVQFDYLNKSLDELFEVAEAFEPDIFFFQLQDANKINPYVVDRLRRLYPAARFINWNGDYHPENLFDPTYVQTMQMMDLVGVVTTEIEELYNTNHVNWFYWQIGYEESNAEPNKSTPKHDVVFLGNGYNEARIALGQFLLDLRGKGWDVGIYGNWQQFRPNGANLYNFDEGRKLYRNAKFAISTQQYQTATGFVSNRLFQAMAAGKCCVLQQRFPGMEMLGLEDGEHYVVWDDFNHLEELLDKLDGDEYRCLTIAEQGTDYVLENYSFNAQVHKLMYKMLECGLL